MNLLIIRHGQSEADILKVFEGRADFPLTELGLQQADKMAKWVTGYMKPDKIFASTLIRARQTAEKLSAATKIPIEFTDELMEWNNGLIAGLPHAQALEKYPPPSQKHPHTALYNQESEIEFRTRAEVVLSKIINENPPDANIAIVSHGHMITRLYRSFLCLPMVSNLSVYTADTGIHHWQIEIDAPSNRKIVFANSTCHLRT